MKINKEYNTFATLASRLAESVLMDWDKEEQARLAKEVACECHEIFNEKEDDKGRTTESAVQVLRTPSNGG